MSRAALATYERVVTGNPVYDDDLKVAPWEIDVADFVVSKDSKIIGRTLEDIRTEHALLVLTSLDGIRYGNTILVQFDDETLDIDRPIDFDKAAIPSFRIFFRDITGVWCFFEVEVINDCPFNLCTTLPDAVYRLHKRQYQRVNVPAGTKVLFRHGDNLHRDYLVKNLSASGMLICADSDGELAENIDVTDITLELPSNWFAAATTAAASLLPIVKNGLIVRSFGGRGDLIYLGISFKGDFLASAELKNLFGQDDNGDSQ